MIHLLTHFRVVSVNTEEFGVGVCVHQGSVLSPLLFIIAQEVLSHEFRTGVPWELLYVDDLVLIAYTLEKCIFKFKAWKAGMGSKGLRVNMKKTKFMVSGIGLDVLENSRKYTCAVCRCGVGNNSIECSQYELRVHKKCSDITGWLLVFATPEIWIQDITTVLHSRPLIIPGDVQHANR